MINNKMQHYINYIAIILVIMLVIGLCGSYELGSVNTIEFLSYICRTMLTVACGWCVFTNLNKIITNQLINFK